MKKIILALIALLSCTMAFSAAPLIIKSEDLKWEPSKSLPGAEVAVMTGNPDKKGPFIARIKLPANFQIPVHTHKIPENDTVISGVLYLGVGSKMDPDHVEAIPAGGFFMVPANVEHYAITKEETILQINGTGPWGIFFKK